jgi:phosphopantothenoylcysteine decarboxylase/phosphopantothenate--cysteine ligase
MIVLNSLNHEGAGFIHNTNKITIIDRKSNIFDFDLKDKSEVAKDIIIKIVNLL